MITEEEMLPLLSEVSPGFEAGFLAASSKLGSEQPVYPALGQLARYMKVLLDNKDSIALLDIFFVIECWCREGDDYVKEAATVGLIENLQNINVVGSIGVKKFYTYLLPESKKVWHKVARFWTHGEIIK